MEQYPMSNNEILDWNARIEDDGKGEFTILPPGEYTFRVTNVEFTHSNRTNAPMAAVTLEVEYDGELVNVFDYLVLTKKAEWKLCSFFRCIGMKKHGESIVMNWNKAIGGVGRAKIYTEKFTKKDGTPGESNKVKSYIDPPIASASSPRQSAPPPVLSPSRPPMPPAQASLPASFVNSPDEDDDGLI
jgi:hypothetical protein